MALKILWLGVIGIVGIVVGFVLDHQGQRQLYPGLFIVAGCLALAVCLLVSLERSTPRGHA